MPLYNLQEERLKRRILKKLSSAAINSLQGRKPKNILTLIFLGALLLVACLIPSPKGPASTGNAYVIDGDTLQINGQRFRLYGIDAPESDQSCTKKDEKYSCGKEATSALAQMIGNQTVVCEKKDIDKYNRIVAICRAGEIELNKWMVANGHAVAYRQYSSRYILDELQARIAGRGLWSGSFQKPWDYRHNK